MFNVGTETFSFFVALLSDWQSEVPVSHAEAVHFQEGPEAELKKISKCGKMSDSTSYVLKVTKPRH